MNFIQLGLFIALIFALFVTFTIFEQDRLIYTTFLDKLIFKFKTRKRKHDRSCS